MHTINELMRQVREEDKALEYQDLLELAPFITALEQRCALAEHHAAKCEALADEARKHARIDALDEAAAICQANASMCSDGVMKMTLEANATAIESLKGNHD